ncbi:hypothetical protein Cantr_05647 [Candida viswanathii]|uniref:Uncharacterized protein n=1 Tax=Candida viswanathii TaxID=5486 RepID=A0A367XSS1_9ASCO|nr:hypothetical protein Cantr_05647 [Candida viswanathii]
MRIPAHLHAYHNELQPPRMSSHNSDNEDESHHHHHKVPFLQTIIAPRPDIHDMIERTHIEDMRAFNVGRNTVELIKNDQNELEILEKRIADKPNEPDDEVESLCSVIEEPVQSDLFLNIGNTLSCPSRLETLEIISDGDLNRDETVSIEDNSTVSASPSTATFSYQPTMEGAVHEFESYRSEQPILQTNFSQPMPKREIYGFIISKQQSPPPVPAPPSQQLLPPPPRPPPPPPSSHLRPRPPPEEDIEQENRGRRLPPLPATPPSETEAKFTTPKDKIFDLSGKTDFTISPVTPLTLPSATPTKSSSGSQLILTTFHGGVSSSESSPVTVVPSSPKHTLMDPIEFPEEKRFPSVDEELVSFIVSKNKLLSHHQKWLETLSQLQMQPQLQIMGQRRTAEGEEGEREWETKRNAAGGEEQRGKNLKTVLNLKRITNIEDTLDDEDKEGDKESRNKNDQKISPSFTPQEKHIQFMHPGKKKQLKELFYKNTNNTTTKLNHSTVTLTPKVKTKTSVASLDSSISLNLESKKAYQQDKLVRSSPGYLIHKAIDSPASLPTLRSNTERMVSRKISSSSDKTTISNDTMIEVLGKPETIDTNYNSSREFIPTRAPPPPKINHHHHHQQQHHAQTNIANSDHPHHPQDVDTEENASSSQSSKISKQEKFQEFSKKIFKKGSQSSLEAKTFYEKLLRKEKKRGKAGSSGVDKNIQTDDITNTLTLEMLGIKKKREKQYKEEVTLSLKSFLDANSLSSVVDSFKDYVERSLI